MINLNSPNFFGNELKYLNECIKTGWVSTSGKYIKKFENKVCAFTKSKYSVGIINATSALDISLKLLGVKENDEIIAPTLTFISPINSILYNKASPIFMDCDKFCNIDSKKVIKFINDKTVFKKGYSYNKISKKRVSVLIVVHVWGNAVYLDDLISLCKKRNIKILEDASESLGTFYSKGKNAGKHTGTIGDLGCISFNANKIITCGGGGVILTNKKHYAKKANYLVTQAKDNPIKYIHNAIGYNLKMTNVHAAIGLAQFENISKILRLKKKINSFYKTTLSKINNVELLNSPEYSINNNWFNILKISKFNKIKNIDQLIKKFHKYDIQTRPIWQLNHLQKHLKNYQIFEIKLANKIIKQSLCLPSSSHLTQNELNKVIKILKLI